MSASFEEKSVWITLAGLLVTFNVYFFLAGRMLAAGVDTVLPYLPLLAVVVALLVVILAVGHAAVAIKSRPEGRDERDRLIAWRAENNSSWVLGVGTIVAIFALATPIGTAWVANGLLAALFLSEVLGHVLQLVYYRRGM